MLVGGCELSWSVRANPTTWLTTAELLEVESLVHADSLFIDGVDGRTLAYARVVCDKFRAVRTDIRLHAATVLRNMW